MGNEFARRKTIRKHLCGYFECSANETCSSFASHEIIKGSGNGICKNDATCACYDGWKGSQCNSIDEKGAQCSYYSNCLECREDLACGWCDDGSGTGLGKCIPGGHAGPTHAMSSSNTCSSERWHFLTCPSCQCNGHASCRSKTRKCLPCHNHTMGPHCERCVPGYWGNPVNGGKCEPCECNGQASQCHPESGKCYCTTKGFAGNHCDKCDHLNHYYSDPINKEFCYYDLTTDYQFTFNLSKKEDRHYTHINFRNSPIKPNNDVDFQITCSKIAKVNITVRSGSSKEEKLLYTNHNCTTTLKTTFSKSKYSFGIEDNAPLTTFHVYVYDFQTPLSIQVSFSQYPRLNLQQLFVTFATFLLRVFLGILG